MFLNPHPSEFSCITAKFWRILLLVQGSYYNNLLENYNPNGRNPECSEIDFTVRFSSFCSESSVCFFPIRSTKEVQVV